MSALSALSSLTFPSFFAAIEQEKAFLSALKTNRLTTVRVEGSVEDFDERGYNPLHCAIETQSSWDLISTLLNHYNANINAKTQGEGWTALILAIKLNDSELVKNILETPFVDVNMTTSDGRTALHFACQTGNAQVVDWLLDRGASVDLCMKGTKMKPIHFAVLHKNLRILRLFKARGFALNSPYARYNDEFGSSFESCLHLLARLNETSFPATARIEMAVLLADDITLTLKSAEGKTALQVAIEAGNEPIIAALLVLGAEWTGGEEDSLISALKQKFPSHSSIDASLLAELLDFAVESGNFDLILALKAIGVSADIVTETVVIKAMMKGDEGIACDLISLLAKRSNVNFRDLLYFAVFLWLPRSLAALIEAFNPRDFYHNDCGQSLLHVAAMSPDSECLPKAEACTEVIKILVHYAPHLLDEPDITGNTPVHLAATSGSRIFMLGIFGVRFDVDKLDANSHTALYLAFKAQKYDVCLTLIQLGAQEDLAFDPQNPQDRFTVDALFSLFKAVEYDENAEEEGSRKERGDENLVPINTESYHELMQAFEHDHEEIVFERQEKPIPTWLEASKSYLEPFVSYYLQALINRQAPERAESSEIEIPLFMTDENPEVKPEKGSNLDV